MDLRSDGQHLPHGPDHREHVLARCGQPVGVRSSVVAVEPVEATDGVVLGEHAAVVVRDALLRLLEVQHEVPPAREPVNEQEERHDEAVQLHPGVVDGLVGFEVLEHAVRPQQAKHLDEPKHAQHAEPLEAGGGPVGLPQNGEQVVRQQGDEVNREPSREVALGNPGAGLLQLPEFVREGSVELQNHVVEKHHVHPAVHEKQSVHAGS
mmetsp:Transcript_31266/g.68310  ORF Transcript_31266/g.68310 Transcript_31266/m.68310 type:complete len:208 (-) Transcript_31266:587-1210(-)